MAPEQPLFLFSRAAEGTTALGEALGAWAPAGLVLALTGELGVGKTCLVRGIARGLGIETRVASPSYTLMQTHEGGRLPLHHFDAWMEGRQRSLLSDGGDDWFHGQGICAVEWASRVEGWLPLPRLEIGMCHLDLEHRLIRVRERGQVAGMAELLQAVQRCILGNGFLEVDAAGGQHWTDCPEP